MTALYHKNGIIGKLKDYFFQIFADSTRPTMLHLFDLVLSVLALNCFQSVKFSFDHFIAKHASYKLKSCYYALNEGKIDLTAWMSNLIRIALRLLPKEYSQPIIISIDDTMVEKSGSHFECRSKMFDHAMRNGSAYLDGHCFVCLMLSMPVMAKGIARYVSIPVAYRMWDKQKSKIDIACELAKAAMEIIGAGHPVFLCCDSWYPKGAVLALPDLFSNLAIVCNVRSDTVLYALAPERNGKRGRPRQRGDKLSIDDFSLRDVFGTDFQVGYRVVLTNLFGKRQVFAVVTKARSDESRRLFLCTKMPEEISFSLDFLPEAARSYAQTDKMFLPLSIYALRWNIEIAFYEQKAFWALGDYKLRSKAGIERLTNLLALVFSSVQILPMLYECFDDLAGLSPQEARFRLGSMIRRQVFLTAFANRLETGKNNRRFVKLLRDAASDFFVSCLNLGNRCEQYSLY